MGYTVFRQSKTDKGYKMVFTLEQQLEISKVPIIFEKLEESEKIEYTQILLQQNYMLQAMLKNLILGERGYEYADQIEMGFGSFED